MLGARAGLGFVGWLPGTLRSPRGTWGPPEEKEEEEGSRVTGSGDGEPGDGDRDCAAGLRASPAASHGGSSPTWGAGKLRHGGVLAPVHFGLCAGGCCGVWVVPRRGGRSASCPRLDGGVPGCTMRAPWRWGAGAGVPGPLGGMRGQCLVLIKTLLVILLWLAASPALPT